jgi:hypothetical protein
MSCLTPDGEGGGLPRSVVASRLNLAARGIAERNSLYPPGVELFRCLDASILRRIQ